MKSAVASKFNISSLEFNKDGLIPVIAQDHLTHEVLMLAWMDGQAIRRTLESKDVTYWSRSRQEYWIKGETSGNRQKLVEMRIDCDRDCLLVVVEQVGSACHTGRRTCFFTAIQENREVEAELANELVCR